MSVHIRLAPSAGEACWWTIHPASKQRSEGEKVRVGDDLILVSVSSERYLVRLLALHPLSYYTIDCGHIGRFAYCDKADGVTYFLSCVLSICPTPVEI